MPPRRPHAFSLVELLTTLALLVIVLGCAVPALSALLHRQQQENLRHLLLHYLHTTRATAIDQRRRIELCGSSDGSICDQAWDRGWLIRSSNGQRLHFYPLPEPQPLRWTRPQTPVITYQPNGLTLASNGRLILCSEEAEVVWQIVINRQGRVRHRRGLEPDQNAADLCH